MGKQWHHEAKRAKECSDDTTTCDDIIVQLGPDGFFFQDLGGMHWHCQGNPDLVQPGDPENIRSFSDHIGCQIPQCECGRGAHVMASHDAFKIVRCEIFRPCQGVYARVGGGAFGCGMVN